MKKIVVWIYLVNLLISILLFVAYRIVISQTETVGGSSFHEWNHILLIVLNLGFSLLYLIVLIVSSFAILLNFYLSLLSFLGIPAFCAIIVFIDIRLKNLILFSIIYLLSVITEFLVFRRFVKNSDLKIKSNNDLQK